MLDAARGRLWGQVRRRDTRTVNGAATLGGKLEMAGRRDPPTDSRGYWSWSTRLIKGASYRYVAANATSATLKRG